MNNQPFNRSLLRLRRNRIADQFLSVDFLKRHACAIIADRLEDMQRTFPLALDLGCHRGELADMARATGKVDHFVAADLAERMVHHAPAPLRLAADEEALPFAVHSFDAILSAFVLHWVNDLPGCLAQCRQSLKPDGLFLAVLPGGATLQELRTVLLDLGDRYGVAPRLSPTLDLRDAGALLQRAGFALPVVDSERVTLTYREPQRLFTELRAMGETNMLTRQFKGIPPRYFWPEVLAQYHTRYARPDGTIPVTVELLTVTAWAPHASQQQPAKRGSGTVSLNKFFS